MIGDLSRNWWALVLRGAVAVLFGIIAFVQPGITIASMMLVFAAYAFVDGVLAIVSAISGQGGKPWWALVLKGVTGIGAAIVTIISPGITPIALLIIIALWAIASGILEIWAAIRLRKLIQGEWMLILAGILSIFFGAMMITFPGAGVLAVLWVVASYAIVFGILLMVLGFRLRGAHERGAPYETTSARPSAAD
jgi:uncharacterized membrane protein HdeD (DUF308 family)